MAKVSRVTKSNTLNKRTKAGKAAHNNLGEQKTLNDSFKKKLGVKK